MQATQVLGGYSAGQADSFRKAIGKKKQSVMDIELPKLHTEIIEHGFDKKVADDMIELIKPFVGYGFNKSHAASYALIAYQNAYLKCHYPIEFYTALLSVFGGSSIKASNYIQDAKENGYKITPPDINLSQHEYSIVSDKEILYGFDTIKGLSKKAIDEIMLKRPFTSIPDMVERTVKGQLDKRAIKVLVLSGALDSISNGIGNRMEVFQIILNLRGTGGEELQEDVDGFTKRRLLDYEKELLGVYISGHPLENIAKPIDWEEAYESGQSIQGHALIKEIRRIITKKGDPMAFLMLEFMEQDVSAVCFPNTYNEPYEFRKGDPLVPLSQLLKENTVVKVSGRYEDNNRGEPNLVLNRLDVPVRANEDRKEEIKLLQEEIGVEQEVEEKFSAPVFSMEEIFN